MSNAKVLWSEKLEANLPADSQNSQISSGYMYIKEAPLTQTDKREKANKHQKSPKKTPHLQDSTKWYERPWTLKFLKEISLY